MADVPDIRGALRRRHDALLAKPNVVATGFGYKTVGGQRTDQLCIVCSVSEKRPRSALAAHELVPARVDGHATDVVETGRIRALQARTDRHRPAPGGVSVGHPQITAGTLGCLVRRGGEILILSNNHVLANSNDASVGDPIYQPGPHDGGTAADTIATLEDWVAIRFSEAPSDCPTGQAIASAANAVARALGSDTRLRAVRAQQEDNLVDAAVARPTSDDLVLDEILEIGAVAGVAEATLGMPVQKSGRTTGLTTGEILQIDVTVDVGYGPGRTARFTDQLLAGPMSQGGDSGSAVLDADRNLVGLLFAGSDSTTIFSRIQHVFDLLAVSR